MPTSTTTTITMTTQRRRESLPATLSSSSARTSSLHRQHPSNAFSTGSSFPPTGNTNDDNYEPRLFLIPGGLSVDGALQGNMSSSRTPQWTFGNESWKNSRKICAATRPEDIYVFFLKESGSIYKVAKVLRVESSGDSQNQLVTFSRVIPVVGCGFEEIASLGASQGSEGRLERSCARQVRGGAASDLALAVSKALEGVGDRKQMRLGRAVNMVLAENVRRLERERETFVVTSRSNRAVEESLRCEVSALQSKLKLAEEKLKKAEKEKRRSLMNLDIKQRELSSAKKSLRNVISTAGSIVRAAREAIM